MNTIGQRIKQAREAASLTLDAVGSHLGKTAQAIHAWEVGRTNPSAVDLFAFARLTGVNIEWLLIGQGSISTGGGSSAQSIDVSDQVAGRIVPSVPWNSVSAFLIGELMPKERVRTHYQCGPRSFQTTVNDASNEPEMRRGDSIVVDPDIEPQPGDHILAIVAGKPMVRRVRFRENAVELRPDNADWPPTVIEALTPDVLVGTVVEYARRRRT